MSLSLYKYQCLSFDYGRDDAHCTSYSYEVVYISFDINYKVNTYYN